MDIITFPHPPGIIALIETWINNLTTPSHLADSTPRRYTLISSPRKSTSQSGSITLGGGLAFLLREPSTIIDIGKYAIPIFWMCLCHTQIREHLTHSFQHLSPTIVFTILHTVFGFSWGILFFSNTDGYHPHEFIITEDFNVHVDDDSDSSAREFLAMLSFFDLTQHVNFPTHIKKHILDLAITQSSTRLSPKLSCSATNITDHFMINTKIKIQALPQPPTATTVHLHFSLYKLYWPWSLQLRFVSVNARSQSSRQYWWISFLLHIHSFYST